MARKKGETKSLGQRMKTGREKMGMSIEDLALETGYLPEILREVEAEPVRAARIACPSAEPHPEAEHG